MTKSPHKLFALIILSMTWGRASALNVFECVRALLPITTPAAFQEPRQGVEPPFLVGEKYMIFPEIKAHHVTGFYIYTEKKARYFDAALPITGEAEPTKLSELPSDENVVYRLTSQIDGLETFTLFYAPDLASAKKAYRDPRDAGALKRESKLLKLTTLATKEGESLASPLRSELDLRKLWIQTHNLDEESFKKFSSAMMSVCKE